MIFNAEVVSVGRNHEGKVIYRVTMAPPDKRIMYLSDSMSDSAIRVLAVDPSVSDLTASLVDIDTLTNTVIGVTSIPPIPVKPVPPDVHVVSTHGFPIKSKKD